MSSSSPGTNASSGSGTQSLTEAGAPCAPARLRIAPHAGTPPRAKHLALSTAAAVACVRGAACPPPWATHPPFRSEMRFLLHSCGSLRCRPSLAGVCCLSGQCCCPSRMPWHDESHEGRGTPLPLRAGGLLLASAARRFGLASMVVPVGTGHTSKAIDPWPAGASEGRDP